MKVLSLDAGVVFGRPGSTARNMWERYSTGAIIDSSNPEDREGLRAMVQKLGVRTPLGVFLNNKYQLSVR